MAETYPEASPQTSPVYSPVVAARSNAWLAAKLASANVIMPHVLSELSSIGVHVDAGSYAYKAIPYVIVIALHTYHDWQRIKSNFKWL